MQLPSLEDGESSVVGQGAFGTVVRAVWRPDSNTRAVECLPRQTVVAVKIMKHSVINKYSDMLRAAIDEVKTIKSIEDKLAFKDCILKVYGIASGNLPSQICTDLNISEHAHAVGIVMRFEAGGSLQSLINHPDKEKHSLPLLEKLRLLMGVARGIAELHAIGVIHADIKPDNVLLSDSNPTEVRLADFGISLLRQDSALNMSSLVQTQHRRGTPIYSAPEMLYNPFEANNEHNQVAKPSRKSDVYAFAILAWELLTEMRPFAQAPNEIVLSAIVHQGLRPAISALPLDCPRKIVELIEACWDKDRAKRKLSTECFATLQYHHGILTKSAYDIYISHDNVLMNLANSVSYRLVQLGFRVCFNQQQSSGQDVSDTLSDSDHGESLAKSKVFIFLASQAYQSNDRCMNQLKAAKRVKPEPPIVPLFMEADFLTWSSPELVYLCQLRSPTLVSFDLSDYAMSPDWDSDEGVNADVMSRFNDDMENLAKFVRVYEANN